MLPALLGLLLAAPVERPFADERLLLDRRLETLRRILPDAPNPMADAALLREMAREARLQDAEVLARPPLETGARGHVAVDVSALGHFPEAERFFRQVALSHRLLDVESLTLAAAAGDRIKLSAVVLVPYRPAAAPLGQPPDGTRARLGGVPRAQADAYVRDQALAVAKSEQIAALRRSRRNPRLFLAELTAITRERPVTLSHASLAEEFVVRGLSVGQGPVRALEARFERGLFRVSDFLMRRRGACVEFEARGRSPVAGPDAELPLPSDDPFLQDENPCRVERDSTRLPLIKSPAPKRGAPQGPFTLRLRDVDLADVFQVLHLLTGEGFVVDGDVAGRVQMELSGVTLDEALAMIQKGAALRISDRGPLRRVSLARTAAAAPAPPRPPAAASPEPAPEPGPGPESSPPPLVSFSLKRAELRDVLAVMTDLDPSLATLGPAGSLGRISLWTREAPLRALRELALAAAGLAERIEEGRRIVGRNGHGEEAPVAAAGDERRLVLEPHQLSVAEFELAGLASAGGAWRAFAHSPSGALHAYKTGDRLFDGAVTAIESTDVALETEDGPLRVLLPPLGR